MFLFLMALLVGGLAGGIGYAIGAAMTDNLVVSLLVGGAFFTAGFLLWEYLVNRSGAHGHHAPES